MDVLNFYITPDLLQIAQIWCQSEEGILSRQLSCLETTARHAHVVPGQFFVFQQDGAPVHREHNTVTFLDRETRETRRRLSACVRVRSAPFEHEF